MGNYQNSLVNLIKTDFQTANLEQTLAGYDSVEKKIRSLALTSIYKETGEDFRKWNDDMLQSAGLLTTVREKMLQLVDAAIALNQQNQQGISVTKGNQAMTLLPGGGAVDTSQSEQTLQVLRELIAQTDLYSASNQKATQSLQQLNEGYAAEKAALTGTAEIQATDAAVIETDTVETVKNAEAKSNTIRAYAQLSPAVAEHLMQLINEGQALDQATVSTAKWAKTHSESIPTLNQVKQYLIDQGFEIEKVNQAMDRYSQGIGGQIRESRAMRYEGLALMSVFSMMSLVMGEDIPNSLRALEKSFMLITSGSLATSMMGLGGGIGFVAGLVAALGAATFQLDQPVIDLNKNLDQMAKKNELVDTLGKILDLSKSDAQAMYDLAKNSPEAATHLKTLVDNTRDLAPGEQIAQATAAGWQLFFDAIGKGMGDPGVKDFFDKMGGLAGGAFKTVFPTTGFDLLEAQRKQAAADAAAAIEQDKAQKQSVDAVSGAYDQASKTIDDYSNYTKQAAQAEADHAKSLDDSAKKLADIQSLSEDTSTAYKSLMDAERNADRSRADSYANLAAQQKMQDEKNAQQFANIQDTLRDSQFKAWQSYNDKLQDAGTVRREKLTDIDREYHKSVQDLQDQQAKDAYDLAEKLYTIERDRQQKLYDLDFTTALDISKAKTQNDKDEIEWRAMQQRAAINQNADNQREDALNQLLKQQQDLATRKRNLGEEYSYRKTVTEREYNDELAKAQRTYQEQLAQAQKSYNDQLAAFQFTVKQQDETRNNQIAQIERQHKQALDDALKRYDDELKAAQKRYNDEKLAADTRYNDEIKKIQETAAERQKAIEQNLQEFAVAHQLTMQMLDQEYQYFAIIGQMGLAQGALAGTMTPLGTGAFASREQGQSGMDLVVPAGYSHDNYSVGVSTGERVKVEPSTGSSSSVAYITVEPIMAPLVQSMLSQLVSSGMLKEGVKLVLNDSVFQG